MIRIRVRPWLQRVVGHAIHNPFVEVSVPEPLRSISLPSIALRRGGLCNFWRLGEHGTHIDGCVRTIHLRSALGLGLRWDVLAAFRLRFVPFLVDKSLVLRWVIEHLWDGLQVFRHIVPIDARGIDARCNHLIPLLINPSLVFRRPGEHLVLLLIGLTTVLCTFVWGIKRL